MNNVAKLNVVIEELKEKYEIDTAALKADFKSLLNYTDIERQLKLTIIDR